MQARPGKQAPDRQALQGLAGAQLALNSFLAELVGGSLRFGQGAFSAQPLLLSQAGSLFMRGVGTWSLAV